MDKKNRDLYDPHFEMETIAERDALLEDLWAALGDVPSFHYIDFN